MKSLLLLLFLSSNAFSFDHNHTLWNEILTTNVVQGDISTLFNYKKLKSDQKKFKSYLKELESINKETYSNFTEKQKLSFWINAYNAYTVKLIIDNYPTKSIKDIKGSGGFFGIGSSPWKISFIKLLGKKMSLDQIEHETIRKDFSEPLIHFAVNCASMGCPSLRNEAFIASKLNEQLLNSAKIFVMNAKKNNINMKSKTLMLSKIFKWYGDDFNKRYGSYKNFLQTFKIYSKTANYKVKWNDYGWDLNEVK